MKIVEQNIPEKVLALAIAAKSLGKNIMVSDARYITMGLPKEISETWIYFDDPTEVIDTGKLGGKPQTTEKGVPKLVLWSSVISVEIV